MSSFLACPINPSFLNHAPYTPKSVLSPPSSPLKFANLFVIEVPAKLWRPKPTDKYLPMDYADDVDDNVFVFEQYGKSMHR
jgi:hypothetical protein